MDNAHNVKYVKIRNMINKAGSNRLSRRFLTSGTMGLQKTVLRTADYVKTRIQISNHCVMRLSDQGLNILSDMEYCQLQIIRADNPESHQQVMIIAIICGLQDNLAAKVSNL
jgi:hypothetical protein